CTIPVANCIFLPLCHSAQVWVQALPWLWLPAELYRNFSVIRWILKLSIELLFNARHTCMESHPGSITQLSPTKNRSSFKKEKRLNFWNQVVFLLLFLPIVVFANRPG